MRLALAVILSLAAAGVWAAPEAPVGAHRGLECAACHPGGGREHRPCRECHDSSANLHPVGDAPRFPVPEAFPLVGGLLACETCHRLHPPTGIHALRGLERPGVEELRRFCFACHGSALAAQDPHRAQAGSNRCSYCHSSVDVAAVLAGGAPRTREVTRELCEVCHDMASRDHPRNVDPVLELPEGLPRGPEGAVTCVTCHDPHGSSEYTHYIREEYARHFERNVEANPHRDERSACRACHVRRTPEELTREDHELRFQGDAMLLCISCHARARSHHPVGMPLPEAMGARLAERGGLPLDRNGRLVCTSCHTNSCASGQQRMALRHYDPRRMDLSLCWKCHPKEEFAQIDPHRKVVDDSTDGCVFCHDRAPVKGLEKAEDLYFVSQVKMICLRCHENLSDSDVSHMGKTPSPEVVERLQRFAAERGTEFPLDREGRFTCTTCHNAHFSAKDDRHKTRLPTREMCGLCHRR